jgi:hypothetical protein
MERRERQIHGLLTALVLLDATLVVWAFAFPDLWFRAFHGVESGSALSELFLRRCGANWAAFLLLQAIAWRRWRADPVWLVVVAGVRLSDIFTDATYAVLSPDPTWFSWATLPLMGLVNLLLGLFLLASYRRLRPERGGLSRDGAQA